MNGQSTLLPELSEETFRQPKPTRSLPMENLMLDQCRKVLRLIVHNRPGMCTGEIEEEFHAVTGLKPYKGWIVDLVESRQVPGVEVSREGRFKRFYSVPVRTPA